jgi:hypothetical protein
MNDERVGPIQECQLVWEEFKRDETRPEATTGTYAGR